MRTALQRRPPVVTDADGYALTVTTTINGTPVLLALDQGHWTATVGAHGLVIVRGSTARAAMEAAMTFLGTEAPWRW